jgi:hypothetical protein
MEHRMPVPRIVGTVLAACLCVWAQADTALVDGDGTVVPVDSARGASETASEASGKPEPDSLVQRTSAEQQAAPVQEEQPESYPQGNPFMAIAGVDEGEAVADSPSAPVLLIDISRGVTLSDLFIAPETIDVTVRPGFVWDLGMRLPLTQWLLVGLAVRYFEATYDMRDNYIGAENEVSTETSESMRFVSLPLELTARLDLKRILPYVSITVEPALFASGFYSARERVVTSFPDRSTLVTERSYDQDISSDRERYQAFAGGGVGIEIPYGFASIYLQGSCLVSVRDIGNDNTRPMRTASRLLYIPVSLGLRFSL